MRMIGLFGGTFNPVHNGHLHLATSLSKHLPFDEIRFIPSAIPPLKDAPVATAMHRTEMLRLAIGSNPQFKLDTREIQRSGKSYTIDTLTSLRQELGGDVSLCWLIGTDAFSQLDQWHRWQALFDYAHFVIVERPHQKATQAISDPIQMLLNQRITQDTSILGARPSGYCIKLEINALDISSTEVRKRLSSGQSVDSMLPKNVLEYIQQQHLYGSIAWIR